MSKRTKVEDYLSNPENSLTTIECLNLFGTTKLRSIVSMINTEYEAFKSEFRIKSEPVKGKPYNRYRMVKNEAT